MLTHTRQRSHETVAEVVQGQRVGTQARRHRTHHHHLAWRIVHKRKEHWTKKNIIHKNYSQIITKIITNYHTKMMFKNIFLKNNIGKNRYVTWFGDEKFFWIFFLNIFDPYRQERRRLSWAPSSDISAPRTPHGWRHCQSDWWKWHCHTSLVKSLVKSIVPKYSSKV